MPISPFLPVQLIKLTAFHRQTLLAGIFTIDYSSLTNLH